MGDCRSRIETFAAAHSRLALASEASGQREHFKVAAPDPRVTLFHSAARQAGI
jgi:hypothetical protein